MKSLFFPQPQLDELIEKYPHASRLRSSIQDFKKYGYEITNIKPSKPKKVSLKSKNLKIVSLNVGNFGISSSELYKNYEARNVFMVDLEKFLDMHDFDILHFQDFPADEAIIRRFTSGDYEYHFEPTFFVEHTHPKSHDSGLLTIWKKELGAGNIRRKFHKTAVPVFDGYHTNLAKDEMISISSSILYDLDINGETITCINCYQSPISRRKEREESILTSLQPTKKKLLLTGDLNTYGVNTIFGPLGLSANPYSFGWNALWTLLTGKNIPEHRERLRLETKLNQADYYIANHRSDNSPTIGFYIGDFAPKPFKKIFENIKVTWLLDYAITNIPGATVTVDPNPFGDFDHSSLIVNLKL